MIIASDRKQSRVILRYIRALLTNVPMLAAMITRETAEAFDLDTAVTIEVQAASFKSTRGYAIAAALCDEISFWAQEGAAEPDFEVLAALRPSMAQFPNAMLLCASSPYARRGALWTAHRQHYAKDNDPILVWQAPTRTMNPTVPERTIAEAMERDPASAASEWLSQFRSDIESYISRDAVEACIAIGVRERAPLAKVRYSAFIDPSGGSADSMTLAIGHKENDVAILDAVRESKPPFSPEDVVLEFSTLLKSYRVTSITGDRYAGEWPRERFREQGIRYEPAAKPKSDLYRDMLPVINSRKLDLLDDAKLIGQLCGLERRTARGGKDSIDHAPTPNDHDDICNAVAGVVAALAAPGSRYRGSAEEMKQWVGVGELEIWPYGQRPLSMHPFLFWK